MSNKAILLIIDPQRDFCDPKGSLFVNGYIPKDIPDGNQLEGIALCEEAMKVLNENINDGWN